MVQRARQPAMETETMTNKTKIVPGAIVTVPRLGLRGRVIRETPPRNPYSTERTYAVRWFGGVGYGDGWTGSELTPAAAADEIDGGAPLLYWRSADGQVDLYGGAHAADIDKAAEAATFLRELLAQCGTETERASIAAGRVEWVSR